MQTTIATAVKELFDIDIQPELTRPDPAHGDFATNVALQLAKQLGQNPRAVAEELVAVLRDKLGDTVTDVSIAGPGFINLRLSDQVLLLSLKDSTVLQQTQTDKVTIVEYSDPNPFKVLHVGHLYD